jgi:Phage integrase family/Phage integrase, N-terminal SAM-like domain
VDVDRSLKPSSFRGYRSIIGAYLLPAFGSRKPEDITMAEVERWRAGLESVNEKRLQERREGRAAGEGEGTEPAKLRLRLLSSRYLDGSALRRRYKKALEKAALRPLRFHDLRHTFGTRMITKADIRRVQECRSSHQREAERPALVWSHAVTHLWTPRMCNCRRGAFLRRVSTLPLIREDHASRSYLDQQLSALPGLSRSPYIAA